MLCEVGRLVGVAFTINIHINSFAFGCRCEFPFSVLAFLFHFLFFGFCLLVDFVFFDPADLTFIVKGILRLVIVYKMRVDRLF